MLYVCVLIAIYVGTYVRAFCALIFGGGWEISLLNYMPAQLIFYNYSYVVTIVLLTIVPGRIARMKSIALKVSLLNVYFKLNFPYFHFTRV
jgi:hypothetical protein